MVHCTISCRYIFDHTNNTDGIDERQTHPLAGTSISDMMAEFSKFKYGIIMSGYFLMVSTELLWA